MTSLTRFESNDGLELIIDVKTGETFASISSVARMCDRNESVIRSYSSLNFHLIKANIPTTKGLRSSQLLTEDQILEVISKYKPELSLKFSKLGLRASLHQLAGYKVTSSAVEQKNLDSDLLAAMLTKMNNFEYVAELAKENIQIRKYSDSVLPGLNILNDSIVETGYSLPAVKIYFTAPQWIDEHASHLTTRQRSNFCKEIAACHRLLVDNPPEKVTGVYQYNNDHEILFKRVLEVVEKQNL